MTPPGFDEGAMHDQEAASILLLRVALRLLGEARLHGSFGEEEKLAGRAAMLADELTGGAPSPDPRRAPVEVSLIRPDRISLSAPFAEASATTESLMLDGTLYDGATVGGFALRAAVDEQELSPEERADLERLQAEWRAQGERLRQFTATHFVRAVAAPPQPGAESRVLAVLVYEDGFYVELTYDTEPPQFDPEMSDRELSADEEDPEIRVEDDLGTEYFESGSAGGGGARVWHSSLGFAPAPPAEAQLLRISAGDESVELDLGP